MTNELSSFDISEIKGLAREKLGLCRKGNDIIGTQIFSILSLYARVIYYPLGKDAPWGFTRIDGSSAGSFDGKPFAAINSSIPVDCQVFAAAHELYHIWYEQNPDVLPSDLLINKHNEIDEKKANRFAAEFLVDEQLLRQEIELYRISEFAIKSVLTLSALFSVPYRTMTKRLFEIGKISGKEADMLLSESEDSIVKYRKKYSIASPASDERVAIDNLAELTVTAYEKHLITYEKLEYLLEICKLSPEDLGIENDTSYTFPSDDELDSIMED